MAYLSIIMGLLLASPVIFYEVYAFVKPALYENENKVIGYYMGAFIGALVLSGVVSYFLIIPVTFRILIYFTMQSGAAPFIFIKDFYNWVFTIFIINAVFYMIPVITVLLVQVGVLPIKYFSTRNRIIAYGVILLILWIFGPNPDPTPISDSLMMAPFVVIFELAIYFARRIDKTRQENKAAEYGEYGSPLATSRGWLGKAHATSVCKFCGEALNNFESFCTRCDKSQT